MRRSRQGSKKSFSKRRLLQLLVSISLSLLVSSVSSSSSPSSKNLYSILSVPQKATPKEITKAYRKLALKCHPDKVTPEERPKAEKKFKEIGYAHDILSDESKRKRYDMYGEQGLDDNFHPGGFGNNGGGFGGGGGGINMNDIFQQMNQGHAGAGRRSSGASGTSGTGGSNGFHIDLSEILQGFMGGRHPTGNSGFFGGMNNPMGNMGMGNMGNMGGTGMNNPMYNRQQQPYQQQQQTQPRQQQQQQMKPQIQPFYCTLGELSDPNGHTKKLKVSIEGGYEKIYTIHIQPGWKDGTKIKFKAVRTKDSSGSGSSSNNDNVILFPPMTFVLKEKKHKYLKRDGDDLVFTCTVTSRQAMKGAKIKIPLPDGELLEIQTTPNEITKGYTKHIVGKGMPIRRKKNSTTTGNNKSSSSQEFKTRGDFIVKFRIKEES